MSTPASDPNPSDRADTQQAANRRLIRRLLVVTVLMFGFGFALWPLYNVFCAITGLGGRTGQVTNEEANAQALVGDERWVTVTFDANVDVKLPWRFQPYEKTMQVKVGELTETHYLAVNTTDQSIVGQAVPSVAPGEASLYFNKTECFCFSEQVLEAQQSRDMPVRFIVDPELPHDINTLTLSYTFYLQGDATAELHQHDHEHHPHQNQDDASASHTGP
ncbi:MAG: cytochrome c oxidase assembly protein [Xanthomonadales bacterium]|nr:cytochrome c oxidase assembly protein [Xanthomonadales bacterium]